MENFDKTMKFSYEEIPKEDVKSVLQNVHRTLEEPAYIPRQNEARNQIRHIDRDVIMEELVSNYLKESKN